MKSTELEPTVTCPDGKTQNLPSSDLADIDCPSTPPINPNTSLNEQQSLGINHQPPYSKHHSVFNSPQKKQTRKKLRSELTEPEKRLWQKIRNGQLGFKFRRQHGIGPYIVDFYCADLLLVIEVDGDSHFSEDAIAYDAHRDKFIERFGLTILRFNNREVMENMEGVLTIIASRIAECVGKQGD